MRNKSRTIVMHILFRMEFSINSKNIFIKLLKLLNQKNQYLFFNKLNTVIN